MLIKRIVIDICQDCLDGKGEECHTPGCALFLHRVDLQIDENLYHEVHRYELCVECCNAGTILVQHNEHSLPEEMPCPQCGGE